MTGIEKNNEIEERIPEFGDVINEIASPPLADRNDKNQALPCLPFVFHCLSKQGIGTIC